MNLWTASVCQTILNCHSSEVIRRMNEARSSLICKPRKTPQSLDIATKCCISKCRAACKNLANVSLRTCRFSRIDEQDRIKLSRAITSSIRISTIHSRCSARPTSIKLHNSRGDWDPKVLTAQKAVYSSSIQVFAPVWARAAKVAKEMVIRPRSLELKKLFTSPPQVWSRIVKTRTSTKRICHLQSSKRHRLGSISTHWSENWPSNNKKLSSCSCKNNKGPWAECTRNSSWSDAISKSRSSTSKLC